LDKSYNVDVNFTNRIEQFYIKQIPLHELLFGIRSKNISQTESAINRISDIMSSENKVLI